MKLVKYIVLFIILLSCKKKNPTNEGSLDTIQFSKGNKVIDKITSPTDYSELQKLDCDVLFKEIILSSNIDINYDVIKKEKIVILFDQINSSSIKARIDFETDENNMPLKWVKLDLKEEKLYDITNETEDFQLTYNIQILKAYKVKCLTITNKEDNNITVVKPDKYQDGYNTVELSKYKITTNKNLSTLYFQLTKSKEFEGNGLLKSIPKKDTIFNIVKSGVTLNNYYRVRKDKLDIEISYPGGVTGIYLYKQNDSLFFKKVYSPD